jgi:GTP-binding protein HflX
MVFNKLDLLADPEAVGVVESHAGAVGVSALTGEGIEALVLAVGEKLRGLGTVVELVIPMSRGDVLAAVHREGEVLREEFDGERAMVVVRLETASVGRFSDFAASQPDSESLSATDAHEREPLEPSGD